MKRAHLNKKGLAKFQNAEEFKLEPAFEEYQKRGNVLPKAQRGNGNNRLKTFVDPRGSKVKTMIDPMFNVGMKSIYSPQTGSVPALGFDIKGPLFSQRLIKGRDQELRGTGNVGVNYYNTDHLGGFAGPVLQTSGLRGGYDLDYTIFPSARNMKNMAYDVSLDAGVNYGMGEDTDFLPPQDRTSGVGFDASVYGGLRNRKTGASGGLYGSYGSKYSFEPGLRVGAKGQLPVGDRFTVNPNIGYDAQSDAMRYGLSLGMMLKQGGSTSTAQGGSLAEDVIGQIRLGVSPVKVYKDLLRQMIPADEIDNAFTQAGYDENTITQLQRKASKSITDEMVDTSIAERGIKQAKSGRELLNKRKRLPKYQDLGEFPDPTGKFEAEYDQVNLEGEEMDDMNYQLPVTPSTASGSVGVNIPASSVATVTDVTPVTPVVEEQTQPEPEVAEKDIAYNPFGSDMASVEMADATPENEAKMLKEMEEFRNIGAEPGGLRGFAGKVGDFVKSEGFQNFLDDYGTVGNIGVGVAGLLNQFRRDREARDAKNQRRQMTPADMMYSMYEERDGDRGNVDVRSGIYQPDNLVAAMGMEMPSMMPPVIQEQIVDLDTETITRLISAGADIEML